jgi:hypothetical protein
MATQKMTPQDIAEKHNRRTKAAVQDLVKGVQGVEVNPATQAVAKKAKLMQNWNDAMQSGKWERGMKRVTLDSWKASMIDKGAGRVAAGLDASLGKTVEFFAELIPFQNDLSKKIENLPDLTIEDSINRAATWIRGMGNFRKGK